MKNIHLVCNAHVDPVWQWEWEEGAAEAISTFRIAADFCEEFDDFIFCHNEVVLYEWIEEFEPRLFQRIQSLVKQGRWHIMGGWYLQPDCNIPCGESFVRQILLGRKYFQEKFNVRPTTAINFDPFGHSRGLVQVMARSGFDSYIMCRPFGEDCPLPCLFDWEGFDGSRVRVWHAGDLLYNSQKGRVDEKIDRFKKMALPVESGLLLWGIGNHGGGPSREDLLKIKALVGKKESPTLFHSTPEHYFEMAANTDKNLPVVSKSLNPWAAGCYTSQILIKQLNRQLENELLMTEKMLTSAWMQSHLKDYPQDDLEQVMKDLAMLQFHDILPGTSIEDVETSSIRLAHHGLEILSRLKARAFFALTSGQKKVCGKRIPLMVYNPHPVEIQCDVACEYQLQELAPIGEGFTVAHVYGNGQRVPAQMEKERSSIELDWRKRVVFRARLKPSKMNRFECELVRLPERPRSARLPVSGKYRFKRDAFELTVNASTGLIDSYKVGGREVLKPGAFEPVVMKDDEDSWGMLQPRFDRQAGRFKLLSETKSAIFSGVRSGKLPPVRVVEDGDVRTVIEAVFGWSDSFICQQYVVPHHGTQIEIRTSVVWNEKNRLLKLNIPLKAANPKILGQVVFGTEEFAADDKEWLAQKWIAAVAGKTAVSLINDGTYGFDVRGGALRPTLLRSAAYCAHPTISWPDKIVPQDRFLPRIDTGYRTYSFWLNAGDSQERLNQVGRESQVVAEMPMALCFFPSGEGRLPRSLIQLSDEVIELTAVKKAEKGNAVIIRLFEPTGTRRKTVLSIPCLKRRRTVQLNPFEIKTIRIDLRKGTINEVSLDETY